ncbi:MAG: helix-turn-helix transcriptional regulator [bacterium]|nr:helix-turn-helix transcriptional regulator [bacterium]
MGLIGYMELSAGIIVGLVGDPVYVGGFCIVLLALVACPFKLTHIMILILLSLLMFIGAGIYSGMSFELHIQKYGLVNLIETVILAVCASFLNEYFRRNRFLNNLLIQKKSDEKLEQFLQTKGITKRETEILRLVLAGKSNNQIEDKLFISVNTVKNHVYNIFQKMNVKSRVQLVNLLRTVEKNW